MAYNRAANPQFDVDSILEEISMLPDPALQQYAAANKNDMAKLSLAVGESNNRKKLRAAQQAQAAGVKPPPVVDQAIAQIAPQPQLPEQQGIGALAAPNMQRLADGGIAGYDDTSEQPQYTGEPVMRMADGGIAHFRNGGANDDIFNTAFLRTLKYEGGRTNDTGGDTKYGISKKGNPDVDIDKLTVEGARSIYKKRYWDAISGDKLAAMNPTLAQVAFDTAVNQGVDKAKKYVTESGGDPAKLMQLRGEHYAGLVEKNPNKYGAYAKGWMNRLGNLATDLAIPSARAGEVDGQAPVEKESARGAAAVPAMGIAGTIGAGVVQPAFDAMTKPIFHSGTTAGEALARTARATSVPAAVGIGGLKAGDVAANNLRLMSPEQRAALSNNALLSAQSGDTGLAAAIMNAGEEKKDQSSQMPYWDQMKNAFGFIGNTVVGRPGYGISSAVNGTKPLETAKEKPRATPNYDATTEAEDASFGVIDRTPKAPEPKIEAAAPTEKKSRFNDDDLLMLGLGMMANNRPGTGSKLGDLVASAGQAGIGAIAAKREREKSEREDLYRQALAKEATAKGEYYGSLSGGSAVTAQAMKAANDLYDNWMNSLDKMGKMELQQRPEIAQQKQQEFLRQAFAAFKIDVPAKLAGGAPAAASQSDPLGILGR